MRLDLRGTNTVKSNHQVEMAISGSFRFHFQNLGWGDYYPPYQKRPIPRVAAHPCIDLKVWDFHSRTIPDTSHASDRFSWSLTCKVDRFYTKPFASLPSLH